MKVRFTALALVFLGVTPFLGCRKIPLTPSTPVPAGTVVFRFTRKVRGPVEFSVDGTRIPVQHPPKEATSLVIKGLSAGKHRFFLSSAREIFSPDLGELDLPADKGIYQVVMAQRFEAVLYGKPEPAPPAEGLPGVSATLLK